MLAPMLMLLGLLAAAAEPVVVRPHAADDNAPLAMGESNPPGPPAAGASSAASAAVDQPPSGAAPLDSGQRPSQLFEKGRIAFRRAQYQDSISILRGLLYPENRLETEGEVVQAHRMLGVAHVFENQLPEARREFRKLLELRPDYRFDPLLDPAPVVDIFNGVLREQKQDLEALQARREREAALRRARDSECASEKHMVERSRFVAFLPFGAGQFQNRQDGRGWFFLSVEAALAATSVGALVTNFAMFGARPQRRCLVQVGPDSKCPEDSIDRTDENLSRNILRVQMVSGALFFAVAAWGVVDALRNFEPLVPAAGGRGRQTEAGQAPAPATSSTKASFRFAPLLSGSAAGAGLLLTY